MTGSEFKFLRRVRIHDGECGAVARALHHAAQKVALVRNEQSLISDECIPLRQAGSEKASDSTFNERKQMSTKTSIKRIALVAVSALGFGLMSVVPAKAALGTPTFASMGGAGTPTTATAIVGQNNAISVAITTAGTVVANDDNFFVTVASTTKPAAAAAVTIANAKPSTELAAITLGQAYLRGLGTVTTAPAFTSVPGTDADAAKVLITPTSVTGLSETTVATLNFAPITSGVYTFTLGLGDGPGSGSGTFSQTHVITITASAPTASSVVQRSTARLDTAASVDNTPVITVAGTQPRLQFVSGPSTQTALQIGAVYDSTDVASLVGTTTTLAANQKVLDHTAISGGASWSFGLNQSDAGATTSGIVAGTYTFAAWNELGTKNGVVDNGEVATTLTINLVSDAKGIGTLTPNKTIVATDGTVNDTSLRISFTVTDSLGRASYWRTGEAPTFAAFVGSSDSTTAAVGITFGTASTTTGIVPVTIAGNTAVGVYTIKSHGQGGAGDYTLGATTSITVTRNSGTVATLRATSAAGLVFDTTNNGFANAADTSAITSALTTTSITYSFTGGAYDAGVQVPVTIDNLVALSATAVTAPTLVSMNPDGTGSFTISVAAPANNSSYRVRVPITGGDIGFVVTFKRAIPQFRTVNAAPAQAFTVKTLSSNTVTHILDDGYGNAQANKTVTVTVAGRNPGTSVLTTDAAGRISFTLVDAAAVATATQDTITLSHPYINHLGDAANATFTYTITYTATGVVVGNVLVTDDEGDNLVFVDTVQQIPGITTAEPIVRYTATVTDSAGLPLLAGNVVTFAGGADDLFVNGVKAAITDGLGQAFVDVYRNKVGYATITASIGGKSSTASDVLWATAPYNTAGAATTGNVFRNITAVKTADAVAGGVIRVTATVTDRWGNGVSGVPVTITITGAGRLLAPDTSTKNTDTTGNVQFNITSNTGEIGEMKATLSVIGGQTLDAAGVISTPTNPSNKAAVSGVTAGNDKIAVTANFTKDTSVSTAEALLELAKAIGTGNSANAAADAALEAIDAANAATDAANLAAEAADAATVAAEEARDAADAATAAVEALASEVATLVAALKAQITTLANTVAKIAKRVRA